MEVKDSIKDDVLLYFREKFPEMPECPLCHSSEWAISYIIGTIIEYQPEKGKMGDFPILLVTCQNCGYVISISYIYIKDFVEDFKKNKINKVEKK